MSDQVKFSMTPAIESDFATLDTLTHAADCLRDRHSEAALLVDKAAEKILRKIELACETLGVELERLPAVQERRGLSLVSINSAISADR
ncbi:hypothetical protein FPY71_16420 [Aureimonas fodinaquatilis]|uniref:Uncharacterized protein n=1 Tax=Aureimonas fodinaquatilis TaxID=2565783 RepID=A0A5B0DPS3_9HYPH|nr:hypothetical protein [Aureimonas fodinaquatilis]KAA0968476.1 hypothetical protein FPY71_16420 [Aureimonas fodinaquatilis]